MAMLARVTGRTVRWSQDRLEALTGGIHAREQVHDLEVGYDDDGRVLAYQATITADIGAPVLYFSGVAPVAGDRRVAVRRLRLRRGRLRPALRGHDDRPRRRLPRASASRRPTSSTERVLDRIAEAMLGIDPVEVRRRNLLPDARGRGSPATGGRIDVGPLGPHLDQLVDAFDLDGWRRPAGRGPGRGTPRRHRRVDAGAGHGADAVRRGRAVRVVRDGHRGGAARRPASPSPSGPRARARRTRPSWPRSPRTPLRHRPASVTVRDGDTDALPYGMGTWGSRSAVMGGGAVLQAAEQVRRSVDRIAACLPGDPDPRGRGRGGLVAAPRAAARPPRPRWRPPPVYAPGGTIPVPDEHGHTNFDETERGVHDRRAGGRGRPGDRPR